MSQQKQAKIRLSTTADYRENYSNSVQIRVNLWDFFIQFGTIHQSKPDEVELKNFQGIYLSPQQAKALLNVLTQNITQYESAFGEIKIDPNAVATGAVQ
jgi:flagellar protein FlaG